MRDYRNALPAGTQLDGGKYAITDVLGAGGFGVVYHAMHRLLDTEYAIKEYLPTEVAHREGTSVHPLNSQVAENYRFGLDSFLKEARKLRRFAGHPNIVQCADFFEGNGTAYMVMAYENGLSLTEMLSRREAQGRPLEESEIVKILLPLLEGLAAVHAENVLHRDIKPGNIFIRRRDEQPLLLDFGAAKQDFTRHSRSNAAYTDGYAPMELVENEGHLGPWTDVYAIGALMWRMVVGEHPGKVESRMTARVRGRPDPLQLDPSKWQTPCSRSFLEIIERCLMLEEEERFQSVEGLRAALLALPHHARSSSADAVRCREQAIGSPAETDDISTTHKHPCRFCTACGTEVSPYWFRPSEPAINPNNREHAYYCSGCHEDRCAASLGDTGAFLHCCGNWQPGFSEFCGLCGASRFASWRQLSRTAEVGIIILEPSRARLVGMDTDGIITGSSYFGHDAFVPETLRKVALIVDPSLSFAQFTAFLSQVRARGIENTRVLSRSQVMALCDYYERAMECLQKNGKVLFITIVIDREQAEFSLVEQDIVDDETQLEVLGTRILCCRNLRGTHALDHALASAATTASDLGLGPIDACIVTCISAYSEDVAFSIEQSNLSRVISRVEYRADAIAIGARNLAFYFHMKLIERLPLPFLLLQATWYSIGLFAAETYVENIEEQERVMIKGPDCFESADSKGLRYTEILAHDTTVPTKCDVIIEQIPPEATRLPIYAVSSDRSKLEYLGDVDLRHSGHDRIVDLTIDICAAHTISALARARIRGVEYDGRDTKRTLWSACPQDLDEPTTRQP